MSNNSTNQQYKTNSRKTISALLSLLLGIIAIISVILYILFIIDFITMVRYVIPVIVIPGIILGIMGLKSPQKNLAIAGIVLCVIPLVCLIGFLVYASRFI